MQDQKFEIRDSELTKDQRRAIKELCFWRNCPDADNFTNLLYHLISKADPSNKFKLSLAFPDEVLAFNLWQHSPSEEEFFTTFKQIGY